ncbi:MAG TPA: anthranilate synthase component I [Bacteroidota bacterium]|nr:anthranilate synthase component I [Bacteroidota bacterium]
MTFEEFTSLAGTYNVIPVSKTLLADTLTPVSAYLRMRESGGGSFLLESVEGGEHIARYSFIGRDPALELRCRNTTTVITEKGSTRESTENFFDIIHNLMKQYRQASLPHLPRFNGGLVGFIGYDAIRFVEEIPARSSEKYGYPDSILGLYTQLIAFDHLKHQIVLINNVIVNPDSPLREQFDHASRTLENLERLILTDVPRREQFKITGRDAESEITAGEYHSIVQKAKQYITDGDIFQVVLSQRFVSTYAGDVFNVYRALRVVNPSPYLYYLDFGKEKIIGSSPEILVRLEQGVAEVYPIAGTRPRGNNAAEDKALEEELLGDEKERAEHIMLVDLGRNDLGRVCATGTVRVEQLMFVVRYSHVMHIATRVVGRVKPGTSCTDVLKATFPAGTVSGAPKIRAMEIIDELEKYRRGFYAGGVGYFDFSGNMDMCIAIRTMFVTEDRLYLQAGAGIVADSIPEREYQETLNKAHALVQALHMAEGITH